MDNRYILKKEYYTSIHHTAVESGHKKFIIVCPTARDAMYEAEDVSKMLLGSFNIKIKAKNLVQIDDIEYMFQPNSFMVDQGWLPETVLSCYED